MTASSPRPAAAYDFVKDKVQNVLDENRMLVLGAGTLV
jgi:hypothetical protein